jgi:hypothetical protein
MPGRADYSKGWEETVDAIHRSVAAEKGVAARLRKITETFMGRPYIADSLVGGPERRERLVVDFAAFDCITFIEIALALARSRSKKGFLAELEKTRYRDGRVDWSSRHHFFADWLRHNDNRGAIRIRTRGSGSRSIEARLGWIDTLPERRVRFHVVPKKDIRLALPRISDGSIVGFASVRAKLDFFHTGLLFYRNPEHRSVEELGLYQARLRAGKVITQPLTDFLKQERMRGIAFAEPLASMAV